MSHPRLPRVETVLRVAATSAALLLASPAHAEPSKHVVSLELAPASLVGEPQASNYDLGFGFALSYAYRPRPAIGLEVHFSSFLFGTADSDPQNAFDIYHAIGFGLRAYPFRGAIGDLWISGRSALVSSGALLRLGVSGAVGFEFHATDWAHIGPYLRYAHIVRAGSHPLGPGDVGFVQYGIRFSFLGRGSS